MAKIDCAKANSVRRRTVAACLKQVGETSVTAYTALPWPSLCYIDCIMQLLINVMYAVFACSVI